MMRSILGVRKRRLRFGRRKQCFRPEKRELDSRTPNKATDVSSIGDALFHRSPERAGQSLIESCVVIGILCLLLMAFFQLSQLYMAQEILHYAAGRGARAKTVGFNEFMVFKTVRVGMIANAGQMTEPDVEAQAPSQLTLTLGSRFSTRFPVTVSRGPLAQRTLERSRIPMYLGADWYDYLSAILNYEDWPAISYSYYEQDSPPRLDFSVHQHFPLKFPFHQAFYADDAIPFTGQTTLENHYPLYLETP